MHGLYFGYSDRLTSGFLNVIPACALLLWRIRYVAVGTSHGLTGRDESIEVSLCQPCNSKAKTRVMASFAHSVTKDEKLRHGCG